MTGHPPSTMTSTPPPCETCGVGHLPGELFVAVYRDGVLEVIRTCQSPVYNPSTSSFVADSHATHTAGRA